MRKRALACFIFVVYACQLSWAQSDFPDGARPTGIAHRAPLSADQRTKLRAAFEAVLDIETLAEVNTFEEEELDAKRALRTARIASSQGRSHDVYQDIEMVRLTKETCRSSSSASDFDTCQGVTEAWINRVKVELGMPIPPAALPVVN